MLALRRATLAFICLLGALPLMAQDDSGCSTETSSDQGTQSQERKAERRATIRKRKARQARRAQRRREAAQEAIPAPEPVPVPEPQLEPEPAPVADCEPGYDPCVPPFPPDVNCPDVDGPLAVTGSDPHGLDADGDGVACE